ncbi:inositol phosphatase [Synechococcus sp. RSCCF101]|uniref:inositol monophosphatase family protein n=1 Tax=Synechococcus sp. RSCCF101 TaxID=2511069 RepID=UPI0012474784|nr:inositol monophosphatase family protein [Synechococcus sp. RSCCF101]QEY32935.1 inositol phosphatase [Synechococcus sp. RSCCF101]
MTTVSPTRSGPSDPLHALLDRVGDRQRQDFGHLVSEVKPDGTLITACDRWSDQTLVEGLRRLHPGEGVLSEEGEHTIPGSDCYWVVDPLDGTTNFAAGIPYWAISLARFCDGVPVEAVLDIPPLRQRIVAIRGEGAWRNGKPIPRPGLTPSGTACASLCSRSIRVLQALPERRFPGKIRLLGVASLNMVSVAMGQTVAALEASPRLWDIAAAWLVLLEVGCQVRWLSRVPGQERQGEDVGAGDYPVLVSRTAEVEQRFLPWANALSG